MAQYDIDIRDYWRIIKKRKPIIILSMATLLVFSFIFGNYKKSRVVNIYSSSATIRIDKSGKTQDYYYTSPFSTTDDIATEVKTITSFPVMSEVAIRTGMLPDSLRVMPDSLRNSIIQGDPYLLSIVNSLTGMVHPERFEYTNVIIVYTEDLDPVTARDLAQNVVESYREIRRRNASLQTVNSIRFLKDQMIGLEANMDSVKKQLQVMSEDENVLPIYSGGTITGEMSNVNRQRDNIAFRRLNILSMVERIEKDGVIDDSVLSNSFAEEEGGFFRDKYRDLQNMYSDREEKLRYLKNEHPEIRELNAKIETQKKALVNQLKSNSTSLQRQIENYDIRLRELRNRFETANRNNDARKRLEDQYKILSDRYLYISSRLQDFQLKGTENLEEVTIIEPAVINPRPINASTSVAAVSLIGLFLGSIIGLTAAFIFETLDTSIGTIEDVESYLGVPVIGLIPQIDVDMIKSDMYKSGKKGASEKEIPASNTMLVIHYAPKSVLAESYRSMRTNIQFISYEQEAKVLVFTSTQAREGKTTTIVNLALTMAQSGNHVLLIDADLRRPSVDPLFGLERENGLSEIVLGNRYWKECVKTVADIITGKLGMNDIILEPGIDNLHIITCGAIPPNPSELLNSDSMDDFIRDVRKEYDIVLFDCAPTLPATDSAVLGRKVDGVVFVYAVGKVSRGALKRAKSQMDNVKARVIGVVLNGIRSDTSADFHDYKYKEYYYYTDEQEQLNEKTKFSIIRKRIGDFLSKFG